MKVRCMVVFNEYDNDFIKLKADCSNCFGLCCVALHFMSSEGFPEDKGAGQPCIHLQSNFRCQVHQQLQNKGLTGCIAYDCFGAGQKVSMHTFQGVNWRIEHADQMFQVFVVMRQLHEMLWFLTEALSLEPAKCIHHKLVNLRNQIEALTLLDKDSLLKMNIPKQRDQVKELLVQTSELVRKDAISKRTGNNNKKLKKGIDLIGLDLRSYDLIGANFKGAYLIAANLSNKDLTGSDFLGADLRDTLLKGADLSKSIFLTQAQINGAIGDVNTKLPTVLMRPSHW